MIDFARTMEKQLAVLKRLNKESDMLIKRHEKMMAERDNEQAAADQANMAKRKAENALMKGVQADKLMVSEAAKKVKRAATDGLKRATEVCSNKSCCQINSQH